MRKKVVYLDGAANTQIDNKVLKAMKPYLKNHVGNSASTHPYGVRSNLAVKNARTEIAEVLCVDESEVYFTSGATESNNWAIKMTAMRQIALGNKGKKHIICGATEHSSVYNCCKQMEEWGFSVTYANFNDCEFGNETWDKTESLLREDTCLICIMSVNNELGIVYDAETIAQCALTKDIPTLVDCTQEVSMGGYHAHLGYVFPSAAYMSFSAHKFYGPLGVGCLIIKPGFELSPLIVGGAQEQGRRGGTTNVAGVVGMAVALKNISLENFFTQYSELEWYLREKLEKANIKFSLNAYPDHPNIISLNLSETFNEDSLAIVLGNYGVAVSSGSACDATHDESEGDFNPSHVLKSLGLNEREIKNTIRVSFTKHTTEKDIDILVKTLKELKRDFYDKE